MGNNDFGYGSITNTDVHTLEFSLEQMLRRFEGAPLIRTLEVGVFKGETSRAIKKFLADRNVRSENWAIENDEGRPSPYPECKMVRGDSSEVFMQVPNGLHWVFIDGCHCANHTMLDFLHYGNKVVENGFVLFHDTTPLAQNKMDYRGHGPRGEVSFGTATREAMAKLGLLGARRDWRLIKDEWQPETEWGGITVFENMG